MKQAGLLVFQTNKDKTISQSRSNPVTSSNNSVLSQIVNQWAARNHIPINGSFSVTGKCNLRCRHCYSVHQQDHALSTEQVLRILDDLKSNGTLALTLTGGEFFTRKDYRDILSYMCKNKFSIKINSNGTYIDEKLVQELEKYPQLSHLHISLYSADSQIHDSITKVKGSYKKTIQALKLLKETNKIIRINCSVMKSNADTYWSVKKEVGDVLQIPVRYDSRLVAMNNGDKSNLQERADNKQIEDYYLWQLSEKIIDAQTFLHPKRGAYDDQIGLCSAGFSYFAVSEEGDLYPCFQLRKPLGNLVKDKFAKLWKNSLFLNQLRNATHETLSGCLGCEMKSICNLCIGMSDLEDGDVFGKSLECCRDSNIRHKIGAEQGLIQL